MGNVLPVINDIHALAYVVSMGGMDAWPTLCQLFGGYLTLCRGFAKFALPLRVSLSPCITPA